MSKSDRGNALFSDDMVYRYALFRGWEEGRESVLFVMLNPSTADAERDDPTVRRCVAYAKRWGFRSMVVVNLYALRATNPRALLKHPEPIGELNDRHISAHALGASRIVCAWGNHGTGRSQAVVDMLIGAGHHLYCLDVNLTGEPVHPLYQKSDLEPLPFFEGALTYYDETAKMDRKQFEALTQGKFKPLERPTDDL